MKMKNNNPAPTLYIEISFDRKATDQVLDFTCWVFASEIPKSKLNIHSGKQTTVLCYTKDGISTGKKLVTYNYFFKQIDHISNYLLAANKKTTSLRFKTVFFVLIPCALVPLCSTRV